MNPLKAPLNETEIRQAVSVVQREAGLDPSAWFETISLDESGQFADQRGAYVCCYEPASNRTLTGIVLLESDELRGWRHIEGVQARILPDEAAMLRGIHDPSGWVGVRVTTRNHRAQAQQIGEGLYVSLGHGSHGIASAARSGEHLADLITCGVVA